jgi:hypothetical protein
MIKDFYTCMGDFWSKRGSPIAYFSKLLLNKINQEMFLVIFEHFYLEKYDRLEEKIREFKFPHFFRTFCRVKSAIFHTQQVQKRMNFLLCVVSHFLNSKKSANSFMHCSFHPKLLKSKPLAVK